jgi:hypothetical protein
MTTKSPASTDAGLFLFRPPRARRRARIAKTRALPIGRADQTFLATSSSIFLASPNSIRLFSL